VSSCPEAVRRRYRAYHRSAVFFGDQGSPHCQHAGSHRECRSIRRARPGFAHGPLDPNVCHGCRSVCSQEVLRIKGGCEYKAPARANCHVAARSDVHELLVQDRQQGSQNSAAEASPVRVPVPDEAPPPLLSDGRPILDLDPHLDSDPESLFMHASDMSSGDDDDFGQQSPHFGPVAIVYGGKGSSTQRLGQKKPIAEILLRMSGNAEQPKSGKRRREQDEVKVKDESRSSDHPTLVILSSPRSSSPRPVSRRRKLSSETTSTVDKQLKKPLKRMSVKTCRNRAPIPKKAQRRPPCHPFSPGVSASTAHKPLNCRWTPADESIIEKHFRHVINSMSKGYVLRVAHVEKEVFRSNSEELADCVRRNGLT